jgi:glycosyltransferase involved in cell wall biosynthesis
MTQIAAPAANFLAIPRISTIVNSPQADFLAYEKKYLWLKRRLLANAYRTATRVIALSRGLAVELQRYYHIPSDKVQVVYSPIDRDDILAKANEPCPELEAPSCEIRIVCVGRLCEQKGQIYLLEAVKQLVHEQGVIPHVHMVGDGPLKDTLNNYCRDHQIQANVTWHGFLPNPFPLFRKTDLLCLPSLYEGLPNVVMEAMLLGLPILATDCPTGPRELLGDDRLGKLIPMRSASAIVEQILDRLRNPEGWLKRAEQAEVIVKERHSLGHWLSVMQDLFVTAVQEGRRP